MAFDIFLKLDGVTGTSTVPQNQGQIEVYSMSFEADMPVNLTSGAGAGKVTLNPISVLKKADATSPVLFQWLCSGAHFATATLTFTKAGASGGTPLMTLTLKQVLLKSLAMSGSSGGDDAPTETLTLTYGGLVYTYYAQDATGKPVSNPPTGGWNLVTNQADLVTAV